MPRLADQREDYLLKTLREYKSGARRAYEPIMVEVLQPTDDRSSSNSPITCRTCVEAAPGSKTLCHFRSENHEPDRIALLASASELSLMWACAGNCVSKGIETKPAVAPLLLSAAAPWLRKAAPAITGPKLPARPQLRNRREAA